MCGITGIVDLRARTEPNRALLARMNDAQLHRGPDAGGEHFEPGVALGHRRLSIIDLATGQQPLFNEDGTVASYHSTTGFFGSKHDIEPSEVKSGSKDMIIISDSAREGAVKNVVGSA